MTPLEKSLNALAVVAASGEFILQLEADGKTEEAGRCWKVFWQAWRETLNECQS
jgi:hypothetical protein